LRPDLEILPGGDEVPLGSRGISLSGGQRARVSMARTSYCMHADAFIFDDPFASVDGPTGNHIMEHLLMGPLLENKTRIVVCQPERHHIINFDQVIILKDGEMVCKGPPDVVLNTSEYQELLASADTLVDATLDATDATTGTDFGGTDRGSRGSAHVGDKSLTVALRDEEVEGRAEWATIKFFVELGGYRYILGSFFLYFVFTVINQVGDIILAHWSTSAVMAAGAGTTPEHSSMTYIRCALYWFIGGISAYVVMWTVGMQFSIKISTSLHEILMTKLLRAPIDRFYDKNPVGRIMNRMSTDMGDIDVKVYQKLIGVVGTAIIQLVPFAYCHYVMPLLFTIGSAPFYYLLFLIIRYYSNVMVPLRYLNAIVRSVSTIFITEVEHGVVTTRAFQAQYAMGLNQSLSLDDMLNADFASACVRRWTLNRLVVMYSFFVTCIALFGVFTPRMDVGNTGLVLTSMVYFTMQIEMHLDLISSLQTECISLNRIHEYAVSAMPQERAPELNSDVRYRSLLAGIERSAFRGMEIKESDDGLEIVRDGAPIMKMSNSGQALAPVEGFQFSSLASQQEDIKPKQEELLLTTDWHRIVGVNDAMKDAKAIAHEIVHSPQEFMAVRFQSKWLANGASIKISDLCAGYADIPKNVLSGVNINIGRKCKAAIAGTTGCGKSTTILCILRILEPRSGKIEMEGVDIQSLGLLTLRKVLGLVPQDPVIFSGTIRSNLDPFSVFSDNRIWGALKVVQLHTFVGQRGGGLDASIRQEGDNMSFGQRQLLCLARMILRQPSLLLLDEATSAIDPHTQELVQQTIMSSFPDSTLIAIAHRLETIIDFDQVFVMNKGVVVEDGNPKELAGLKGGVFAKMLAAKRFCQAPALTSKA